MPHVLVQLPDQWKGEIRVDELILTNVQHDREAGSLGVWNVVHPSCHETNQSHFTVVMTEAGHSRCKLILNITEIISNKEEKYRKWLQANLLLKRLTASVAVLAFFTLKDKCEKNVGGAWGETVTEKDHHRRFLSGFGQSAVGQHDGTTWGVVCRWAASSWLRRRCIIWPAWRRHKRPESIFFFFFPDGCMKWTLWFFLRSIQLACQVTHSDDLTACY